MCNLPVLAVATMLDVQALWLYDRHLRRVIPAATGQRSMAVLVGSKQLARIQGDNAQGHITEAVFSLPEGDDNEAADARHTIDALSLKAVVGVGRTTHGSRVRQGPRAGRSRCHRGDRTGLWLGAPDERRTRPQGGAMAPATREPSDDVERTANSEPSVHMGRSETERAQLCRCTRAGGCSASPPRGVLRCVGGCVVAVLWRRLRPNAVGAHAAVLRVRGDGTGLGTTVCLRPALGVVLGARR